MPRDESRDVRVEFNTEYDEYDDAHEIVSDVEWHDGELDTHRHKRYVPHSQLVEAERQLSECREQALSWLEWGEAIAEKSGATVGESIFAKVKGYVASLERQLAEKEDERVAAIKKMAKSNREKMDSELARGTAEYIMYETANERGGQFKRLYDEWSQMRCQLAESRAEVERLRGAMLDSMGKDPV